MNGHLDCRGISLVLFIVCFDLGVGTGRDKVMARGGLELSENEECYGE